MFKAFLPQRVDNGYRGNKLAPCLFAVVVLLKVYVGFHSIFKGNVMARSGDGIPMGSLPSAGAQAVVSLYALWGLEQIAICVLCLLVLVRYRALIPLMFALLLAEQLVRKLTVHLLPLSPSATAGESVGLSPFPYGFLILIVVGLILSLRRRDDSQA